MNPKQEIEQLTRELEYHNRQYYVLDDPKIDDYTYDHMLRRLEDLEKEYPQYASPTSPTRRVGGAAISEKHCGFVVNLGGATCRDVVELTQKVHDIVLEKTGFVLEREIRVVGE